MKRKQIVALCMALVMSIGVFAGCATPLAGGISAPANFDPVDFLRWKYEEATWRAPVPATPANDFVTGFVEDASGAPTREEIETILNFASLSTSARGRTDWYMVVLTCPEDQYSVIGGFMNPEGVPRMTSDGTVTILVFSEMLIELDYRTDDVNPYLPRFGYFNAGLVSQMINIGAFALGYGTRQFFMATSSAPLGERWPELEHFIDGKYYAMGTTGELHSTENMKYVIGIVIGTIDNDSPLESAVTLSYRPLNWSFFGE